MDKSPTEPEKKNPEKLKLGRHYLIIYIIGFSLFLFNFGLFFITVILDLDFIPDFWLLPIVCMMFIGFFVTIIIALEEEKRKAAIKHKEGKGLDSNRPIEYLIGQIIFVIFFIGIFILLFPPFYDIFPNLVFPISMLFFLLAVFILLLNILIFTLKNPTYTVPGSYQNKLKLVVVGWAGSFIIGCVTLVLAFTWPSFKVLFIIIFIISLITSVLLYVYLLDKY